MKRPKRLSAAFVNTVKRPGRYGDGRGGYGLSLLVKPTASGGLSKTFAQRITIDERRVSMGLGGYPVVTLARARKKALANARTAEEGNDPRVIDSGVPAFKEAAKETIAIKSSQWRSVKSKQQWESSLRDYAIPNLGEKRVSVITTSDVLDTLLPIWSEKPETARRVRQRISAVMKWAIARGHRTDNPAGEVLSSVLPDNSGIRKHMPALPFSAVGQAIRTINSSRAAPLTKLGIEFLTLTACRSGEVREATWNEIDATSNTWIIPAERMKASNEHRVPLSQRCIEILKIAMELGDGELIFSRKFNTPLTDNAYSKLFRDLKIPGTPHGMRSSFRDWCAETRVGRDIAEAALAHQVKGVEGAYLRTDLFELRRQVMEDWARYIQD